jgi:uncharacterized membrane protein YphA (DoxX/SURF4 family)
LVLRYVLAAVLIIGAITKMYSPAALRIFVAMVTNLPNETSSVLVWIVALTEVAIGLTLLHPRLAPKSSLLTFGLVTIFTIVLVHASQTEIDVPCGCFGGIGPVDTIDGAILRNVLLLTVCILTYATSYSTKLRIDDDGVKQP